MNMFEQTNTLVLCHFIRHYTVNYYFLLVNAKTAKNSAIHWKSHVLNPILLHITTTQCNTWENSIEIFKSIAVGFTLQIQKSLFFQFFTLVLKTTRISGM